MLDKKPAQLTNMPEETNYYWDDQVKVTGDAAAFPGGTYSIASITKAEVLTSETRFLGMDRDYVLPVLGGGVTILYMLARSASSFFYYFIYLAGWIGASVLGFRARHWLKDKRQMYTYTVALHTQDGTIEAYSFTDKGHIRRIVTAINRAVKARGIVAHEDQPTEMAAAESAEQHGTAAPRRPMVKAKTRPRPRGRQKTYRHPASRPEALPRLGKRHRGPPS